MTTDDTIPPPPHDARTLSGFGDPAPTLFTASPAPRAVFARSPAPRVSIIIVTYATSTIFEQALESLADVLTDGPDSEVIVVDNPHPARGHACGDRAAIFTSGLMLIKPDHNLGFGGGNNLGIERASANLVCLLNPDAFLEPDTLPRLIEVAEQHPGDIIAPTLLNTDGTLQEMGMRIISNGQTRPVAEPDSPDVDYASAACWVLSRGLFLRLGGFDPVFHPAYYEDVDFALRVADAGGRTRVVSDATAVHAWRSGKSHIIPDVSRQQAAFTGRWADLVRTRPHR